MGRIQSLLVLGLFLGLGCAAQGSRVETGTVEGTVSFKGGPLTAGTVMLVNESKGLSVTATVNDGGFQFPQAVPVGDYQVAVGPLPAPAPHEPPLPKEKIVKLPAKYGRYSTSGLTATVVRGDNKLKFDLSE